MSMQTRPGRSANTGAGPDGNIETAIRMAVLMS